MKIPPTSPESDDIEAMARLEFQPWKLGQDNWKPPSNEDWTKLANPHLISTRIAWVTLHKSKDELITIADELGDEGLMELVAQIGRSADWFKGLHELLSSAECRIMCTYAARIANDENSESDV